jgi:integral membrane protein (TIGR01906 family)
VLTLAVPTLLAIGSIRLVMTQQFLSFEYTRPDFSVDYYGFTTQDRLEYGHYGIDYLLNAEDIDFLGDLRLPIEKCWDAPATANDCPMYEQEALGHMVDVKIVAETTFRLGAIFALFVMLIFIVAYRQSALRQTIRLGLTYGSMLTLAVIVSIIVLAFAAWDVLFDTFHEIFFAAGTWRFAFSDTLIRLYPEQFWFDAILTIGILTSLGAILILALMWWWSKHIS